MIAMCGQTDWMLFTEDHEFIWEKEQLPGSLTKQKKKFESDVFNELFDPVHNTHPNDLFTNHSG